MENKAKYSEIFGSASKYSLLRVILFSVSYIFYIVITRLLGPEEFGKLALVIQLGTEIGTIFVIGLPTALTRFVPEFKEEEEKRKLFSGSINLLLIVFSGFALIYFLIVYFLRGSIPEEIMEVKYWLFFFIVIVGVLKLGVGMLSGLGRFISGSIFDGATHLFWRLAGMLLLIFAVAEGFNLIFNVSVLVHLVVAVAVLVVLRQYLVAPGRKAGVLRTGGLENSLSDSGSAGEASPVRAAWSGLKINSVIMKFSLTVMASQAVFALIAVVDPLLVRLILNSTGEVGYFYTGTKIPLLFQTLFFAPLMVPFLYYFSKPDSSFADKDKIIRFGTKMLAVVFGAVSFFVYSLADKFILLLFGNQYENSIVVLKIFAFTLFFVALEMFLNPYFLSVDKPFIPVILGVAFLTVVVILDFALIPIFRSAGPAISVMAALALRVTVYFILLKRQGIDFIKTYLIIMAIASAALLIDLFVLDYSGIFVFIILAFATRIIKISDIKNMIGMLRKSGVKE